MKPSTERREAMVGGRSEETENGKQEKRAGHGWSRMGGEDSRKQHTGAGINRIALSPPIQSETMYALLSRASLTPSPLNGILPLGAHPLCQTHNTGQVCYALPVSYN